MSSSTEHPGPLSVRVFLLGDATGADTVEVLTHSLSEQGMIQSAIYGLHSLSGSALQAVNHEIAAVADGLLNLDLGNVLISGWCKYTDLTKAAERTLAAPGSEEVVVLATHRVVSTHHPSIELLIDGVKVHTFVFEVKVVFDLNGVAAVLRRGELVALRGGECVVTATLTLEGTPLELSRKGRIDLALVIPLHRPIPLARRPATRPPLTSTTQFPSASRAQTGSDLLVPSPCGRAMSVTATVGANLVGKARLGASRRDDAGVVGQTGGCGGANRRDASAAAVLAVGSVHRGTAAGA